MSLFTKYLAAIALIFVGCVSESIAFNYSAYSAQDWEKISVLFGVIIMIISPSKYRVIMIGAILGLTFSYYTYKYLVPFLLKML